MTLRDLLRQARQAEHALAAAGEPRDRTLAVMSALEDHGPATAWELDEHIPEHTPGEIEAVCTLLAASGRVAHTGERRGGRVWKLEPDAFDFLIRTPGPKNASPTANRRNPTS